MVTRYRAIPRCYGHYELFGEDINACEIERICVSNDSLSFEEYLQCRKMHLIINLFYNDGVLKEVLRFLKGLRLSVFDWLSIMFEDRENDAFLALVGDFLQETESELWLNGGEFRAFTRNADNIRRFVSGELGANLIFKYRARALIECADAIADVAGRALEKLLQWNDAPDAARDFGRELVTFGHARFAGLFDHDATSPEHEFRFDVIGYADATEPGDPEHYLRQAPIVYRFDHNEEQRKTVQNYVAIYGASLTGYSRILSKVYVRKLFRQAVDVTGIGALAQNPRDLRFGQAALTGLNEFG
jgi:hypothetical protein